MVRVTFLFSGFIVGMIVGALLAFGWLFFGRNDWDADE